MNNFKTIVKVGLNLLAIANGAVQLYEVFKGRCTSNSIAVAATEEEKPANNTTEEEVA